MHRTKILFFIFLLENSASMLFLLLSLCSFWPFHGHNAVAFFPSLGVCVYHTMTRYTDIDMDKNKKRLQLFVLMFYLFVGSVQCLLIFLFIWFSWTISKMAKVNKTRTSRQEMPIQTQIQIHIVIVIGLLMYTLNVTIYDRYQDEWAIVCVSSPLFLFFFSNNMLLRFYTRKLLLAHTHILNLI